MKLLTSKEAAAFLNLTPGAFKIRRIRGSLVLPFVKVGKRSIRFKLEDLEAYANQRTVNPDEKSPTEVRPSAG
jgi:excisionase family DNA binding protein